MPVCQRPTAGDDLAGCVKPNRLELPLTANSFEIANMQARVRQDAADAWAFWLEFEWMCHLAVLQSFLVA